MLNNKKFITEKIKNARLRAGLTQEQFAEKIGLSSKQVSRIECGNFLPSLPAFFRIAEVLNLQLEDFCINVIKNENKIRNQLIQTMNNMSDSELECYYNVLRSLAKNFKPLECAKFKQNNIQTKTKTSCQE